MQLTAFDEIANSIEFSIFCLLPLADECQINGIKIQFLLSSSVYGVIDSDCAELTYSNECAPLFPSKNQKGDKYVFFSNEIQ